ncbi:MAG: RDD family protein [Phycisphaerae bacterium]|nr:RDD family protein [Phycisphaerae bacterium]
MAWYFLNEGKPVGPVNESLMRRLQQSGRVGPGTMVWRQGMSQWQPWAQVQLTLAPDASGTAAETETCCQCGRVRPQSDVLVFGEKPVCASCKPFFLERLREGVLLPPGATSNAFAGFWIRGAAVALDSIILALLSYAIRTAAYGHMDENARILMVSLFWSVYATLTTAMFSATPGKLMLGLRVIRADGKPMTLGLAFARMLSTWLSAMVLGFGFLLAAFDAQKRTLHDGMCDTRVVRNAVMPYKVL